MQTEGCSRPAVVYGYFPCVSEGDDLSCCDDDGSTSATRFTFPRQRRDRHLCLADFFRPRSPARSTWSASRSPPMGTRISEATAELFADDAYRDYLELHGLSVQLTEALAEYWHARIRAELGFAGEDPGRSSDCSPGLPRLRATPSATRACPNLEDRAKLVDLLEPERIGVELSEEFQLHPEQSTDAIIVHHPEAKYFNA